jgi:hypothetical protein
MSFLRLEIDSLIVFFVNDTKPYYNIVSWSELLCTMLPSTNSNTNTSKTTNYRIHPLPVASPIYSILRCASVDDDPACTRLVLDVSPRRSKNSVSLLLDLSCPMLQGYNCLLPIHVIPLISSMCVGGRCLYRAKASETIRWRCDARPARHSTNSKILRYKQARIVYPMQTSNFNSNVHTYV